MKNETAAGPQGWGLEHALDAWGAFETEYVANREFQNRYFLKKSRLSPSAVCQDTPQELVLAFN